MKFLITILILKYCALELNLDWLGGSSFQESRELLQIDHNIPVFLLITSSKRQYQLLLTKCYFCFLACQDFCLLEPIIIYPKGAISQSAPVQI